MTRKATERVQSSKNKYSESDLNLVQESSITLEEKVCTALGLPLNTKADYKVLKRKEPWTITSDDNIHVETIEDRILTIVRTYDPNREIYVGYWNFSSIWTTVWGETNVDLGRGNYNAPFSFLLKIKSVEDGDLQVFTFNRHSRCGENKFPVAEPRNVPYIVGIFDKIHHAKQELLPWKVYQC